MEIVAYVDSIIKMNDQARVQEMIRRQDHGYSGLPYKVPVSRWFGEWPQQYEVLGTGMIVPNDFGAPNGTTHITSTLSLVVRAREIELKTLANKYLRLPLMMQKEGRTPRTVGQPLILAHKILFAHRALPVLDGLLPPDHALRELAKYVHEDEPPAQCFTRILGKKDPLFALISEKK